MDHLRYDVLERLPPAFTTEQFGAEAHLAPTAAVEHLRDLANARWVGEEPLDVWWNFGRAWPEREDLLLENKPLSYYWHPRWEFLLDALHGDAPRRISGMTALAMAGVAVICRPEVSVAEEHPIDTGPLFFASWSDNAGGFLEHAHQITRRTWVSSPARSLLECAQFPDRSYEWEERFADMAINGSEVCRPDEVMAVAAAFDWRDGLRRIASVADALNCSPTAADMGFSIDPEWADIAPGSESDDEWIRLTHFGGQGVDLEVGEHDGARKVWWGDYVTAHRLALNIST